MAPCLPADVQQVDEDPQLSAPVLVDLQQLLAVRITDIQELSLTAAQFKGQQARPRSWKAGAALGSKDSQKDLTTAAGELFSAARGDAVGSRDSSSMAARAGSSKGTTSSPDWGRAFWIQQRQHSKCRVPSTGVAAGQGDVVPQQQQHAARRLRPRRTEGQQGPYNIWDHSSGDMGSIIELFPQEIRTWLLTVADT